MRSLKELLQILLDNVDKYKTRSDSLCLMSVILLEDKIITNEEEQYLVWDYLMRKGKQSSYCKRNPDMGGYLFKPHNWTSRKKWLKQQINKL